MGNPILRSQRRLQRGEVRLGFEWQGGTYISVCQGEQYAHPKEVINVENMDGNRPEFNRANFEKAIDEWIQSYGEDALIHDVTRNWRFY